MIKYTIDQTNEIQRIINNHIAELTINTARDTQRIMDMMFPKPVMARVWLSNYCGNTPSNIGSYLDGGN